MKLYKTIGILVTCIAIFIFGGCNSNFTDLLKSNISEIHQHYFVGNTQDFTVTMWSGYREEVYALDGVHNEMQEFCLLSVVPQSEIDTYGLEYMVEINKENYTGEFQQSPFDKSLATDLELTVDDEDEIFIYVIWNGETQIANMNCVSCNFAITNQQALEIAITELSQDLVTFAQNCDNKLEGYCQISNTDKNLEIYFWYIAFIDGAGNRLAVVVDTSTGEVLAKKV